MKILFSLGASLLFASTSFAELSCLNQSQEEVLAIVATELNVYQSELKIRYIGGEPLDGDVDDNMVKDHAIEYFDVFLADESPTSAQALDMYTAEIYTYSDIDTGEILECDNNSPEPVANEDWQNIYDIYL